MLTLILSGCVKEAEREFPRVKTFPATIADNGMLLKGEISNYESLELEEYGFIYGEGEFRENSDLNYYVCGNEIGASLFKQTISRGFQEGEEYFYMAYAIAEGYLSLGSVYPFIGGGSEPPDLLDFYPKGGHAGDTLKIVCANILGGKEKYTVTFNSFIAPILGLADSILTVYVPGEIETSQCTIKVTAYGTSAEFESPFEVFTPVINSFSPNSVYPGEEVIINGSGFPTRGTYMKVFMGEAQVSVISTERTKIVVTAPITQNIMNSIKVRCSGQEGLSAEEIEVKRPTNVYLSPEYGTYGDQISIYGPGVTAYTINSIIIGGKPAASYTVLESEILATIPNSLDSCKSSVIINYQLETLACTNTFKLNNPSITSFAIQTLELGSELIIRGEYFSPIKENNKILIGDKTLIPISASGTELKVIISPDISTGNYLVGIKTCGDYFYSTDQITIVASRWARVADFPGGGIYKTAAFENNGYGYTGLGFRLGDEYPSNFWRYDPGNNSWSSIPNFPGTPRVIAIASSSKGKGVVGGGFDSNIGGRVALSDYYTYDPALNSWQFLTNNPAPTEILFGMKHGLINEKLYILNCGTAFYSLDTNPVDWTNLSDGLPAIDGPGATFVIGDICYFVSGKNITTNVHHNKVWAYDANLNTWEQKNDFPGPPRGGGSAFAINGKGYFGLGSANPYYYDDFWEYDPANDTWASLGSFPGNPRASCFVFVINNQAYIGTGIGPGLSLYSDMYRFIPTGQK